MAHNSFYIECLKNDIELKIGRSLKSPTDFDFLSYKMQTEREETLSSSTLQRLWNYVSTKSVPRTSTLSLLCRFLGYSCWDSYVADLMRNKTSESDYITAKLVRTRDLCNGDILHLGWPPNRELSIRYEGDFKFTVIDSINSKLKVNDTFIAMSFSLGNPMILTNLIQGDESPCEYIAGKKHGLTMLEILPQ